MGLAVWVVGVVLGLGVSVSGHVLEELAWRGEAPGTLVGGAAQVCSVVEMRRTLLMTLWPEWWPEASAKRIHELSDVGC